VPNIKTIVVGNLALGGTGKTPHTDYILSLLESMKVAMLSRGYGRNTTGSQIVQMDSQASAVGDEPLELARKHDNKVVVVDENRRRGLEYIQRHYPSTELVVLDDALQHRQIVGGFNILLTTWYRPFYKDNYLPAGNLRDSRIRAADADLIIITKCPDQQDPIREAEIRRHLSYLKKPILFSRIAYGELKSVFGKSSFDASSMRKVLIVTGIAEPKIFVTAASSKFKVEAHFAYRDHHQFNEADLGRFRNFIGSFAPGQVAVLTTQKDAMRMLQFTNDPEWNSLPIFYWEIEVDFGKDKAQFDKMIKDYANRSL
jgi:tetraacyldisaccharide 4'-kinase